MKDSKEKRKKTSDKLTYSYIRNVRKRMLCPACQQGDMLIDKESAVWTCEKCRHSLSADEFEDDYVFWFCDMCGVYLNNQEGFDINASSHLCRKCGYNNDISPSKINNSSVFAQEISEERKKYVSSEKKLFCKLRGAEMVKRYSKFVQR